ncbi:SDR family NAD(P)-dependent oxidoreductase [Vibrio comitans]
MQKTILITGATDGIGLETAKTLAKQGHSLLIHGRNPHKLQKVQDELSSLPGASKIETYESDLSRLADVKALASSIVQKHSHLDALINNAGVYRVPNAMTTDNLDVRFAVNTLAPYLLTQKLLPLMNSESRVVNLSSAAQSPVDINALLGEKSLSEGEAYAQSKLAITMWTRTLAQSLGANGPAIIAVNPASFLGSKMVKDAYGVAGGDLSIGADILVRAALSEEFADATGKYFDNDIGRFNDPHRDALNSDKCHVVVSTLDTMLETYN